MKLLDSFLSRVRNLGRTTRDVPGERTYIYVGPSMEGGVRVDEQSSLGLAAVFACIRSISEDLGKMPCHVHNEDKSVASEQPADWILYREPNPEMTAFTFRETIVSHALGWGNGYAEVVRDRAGRIAEKWLMSPDRVNPDRTRSGRLFYDVWNGSGQPNTALEPADVFHLHGLGYDGLKGYSVIGMHRKSIGLGLSMQETGTSLFGNASIPSGILKYKTPVAPEVKKLTRDEWNSVYSGPRNRGRIAVMDHDLEFQSITMPLADAQFIESNHLNIETVCRIFRVPPHKVQHLLRSTFSNIEEQNIEYVQDTLMPWAARFEQESDRKLLGRNQRGRLYTKINLTSLLRGDSTKRSAYDWQMYQMGVYSANDIRELEDMPSIGSDGDKRFVPANMVLLEKAGEEPPAPPAPEPAQQQDDTEDMPSAVAERMNGNGATNGRH